MDKKYISCLVNDKVGVCAISLVLDKRHVRNGGKYPIALRFTIDRKDCIIRWEINIQKKNLMLFVEQKYRSKIQY